MPWILVLWATVVAYSRIYLGVHFPLDVISGALVGTFMGWLFLPWRRSTYDNTCPLLEFTHAGHFGLCSRHVCHPF